MEGSCVDVAAAELVRCNINVTKVVHDKDGCTAEVVRRHYPEAAFVHDVGHLFKNIVKRLKGHEPKVRAAHKTQWKMMCLRVAGALWFGRYQCTEAPEFVRHVDGLYGHLTGDHSRCKDPSHIVRRALHALVHGTRI
jgi:hypothetical protein